MLTIYNLSKTIRDKKILDAISLEAIRGSVVFLLGESGVGKSTLLRILNGLEEYDAGTIMLDGKAFNALNIHKEIGMIFQHFNLFNHLSVEDNITLALEKVYQKTTIEAQKVAHSLLAKYKLIDKALAPITALSGGQKQRLAIARALATDPYVICFDEPTSALDPFLTNYVAQQIQELAHENRIIIVATHDISLILNDYIEGTVYFMKEGKIIEYATTKDIKNGSHNAPRIKHFIEGALHQQ